MPLTKDDKAPDAVADVTEAVFFTELLSKAAAEGMKQTAIPPGKSVLAGSSCADYKLAAPNANREWAGAGKTFKDLKDGKVKPVEPANTTDDKRGYKQDNLAQNLSKGATQMRWGMAMRYANYTVQHQNRNAAGASAIVQPSEWWEILDPHHRFAYLMNFMHGAYERMQPPEFQGKISHFFLWTAEMCAQCPDWVRNYLRQGEEEADFPTIESFIKSGVVYMTAGERKEFLLKFRGARLFQGKEPFDTRACSTAHSGAGWAIFVVSRRGQWFAGQHRAGAMHHSSFLAGTPVIAAGEIKAHWGIPLLLSAKSGHYQPTMDQFLNGVASLRAAGVNLAFCEVMLFEGKNPVTIKALEFLDNQAKYSQKYAVWC